VHPAFDIIPSPDAEGYPLPPIQGYKCRFERNGGSLIRPIRNYSHVTVRYRMVVEVINVMLIISLVAAGVFPKALRPKASF
jgi:hypothetical protein